MLISLAETIYIRALSLAAVLAMGSFNVILGPLYKQNVPEYLIPTYILVLSGPLLSHGMYEFFVFNSWKLLTWDWTRHPKIRTGNSQDWLGWLDTANLTRLQDVHCKGDEMEYVYEHIYLCHNNVIHHLICNVKDGEVGQGPLLHRNCSPDFNPSTFQKLKDW